MENAVKALLIAGGVFLSLIIISAGVILYTNLDKNTEYYSKEPEIVNLNTINARFEKYRGRTDLTSQDIITIYSFIEEFNKKNTKPISIYVKNRNITRNAKHRKLKN